MMAPLGNLAVQSHVGHWDEKAFRTLVADIRSRRDEFHRQRHISADVIKALQSVGLYRALVPEEFGGSAMHPSFFMRRIEEISKADGSAGWVASFAFATKYLSSLPAQTLRKIYADSPDIVVAGALYPLQRAVKTDGGVRVSGRWKFASGCLGASVIGVGVALEKEKGHGTSLPMLAVMPAQDVRIEETWDTIGMAGTGSHDLVVDDVFVADDWLLIRGAPPSILSPGYCYPSLAMAAQVLAVVGIGVAQAALDHLVSIAGTKASITGVPAMNERTNVQIHIGECAAKLDAARTWFYDRTDCAWEKVIIGAPVSRTLNMHLRLASSHAARTAADIARACFEMAGMTGVFSDNPLSRYLTDALVVAQHAFLAEGSFMNAGKVMLGSDAQPGYDWIDPLLSKKEVVKDA